MTHKNPWQKLESKIVYENPWLRLREDKVIRPDGNPGIYGVVDNFHLTKAEFKYIILINATFLRKEQANY